MFLIKINVQLNYNLQITYFLKKNYKTTLMYLVKVKMSIIEYKRQIKMKLKLGFKLIYKN